MTVTISGTTGIAGVDGSAATPAVQGGDANTGVFYGTDIVGISTGGTERMRVTSTGVNLNGSTSGTLTIAAPAVAGTNTQTLVAATGTLAPIVSATAQASTSGTSIDFTSIPSYVKRITVMFRGVSTSSTSDILIRLGTSSGVTTTGYATYGLRTGATSVTSGANLTTGFASVSTQAASVYSGSVIFSALGGDIWTGFGLLADSAGGNGYIITGGISLAATLDRVRITTVNGTDTFDAGTINIMYE